MKKAVFLDRDGVLNKTLLKMGKQRAPYTMEEFGFIDGVREAIKILKKAGFTLIVVTNQPDVARGWVSREQVDMVNHHVQEQLDVDEVMSCFHTEKDNCTCRKPRPGMLLVAAGKWDIDLKNSFMIGDRISDVEAGLQAGCRTILVGEGEDLTFTKPHHQSVDLLSATEWILSN